jgi:hypothetical protein
MIRLAMIPSVKEGSITTITAETGIPTMKE